MLTTTGRDLLNDVGESQGGTSVGCREWRYVAELIHKCAGGDQDVGHENNG